MLQHGKNSFLVEVTFGFIKDPSKPFGAGGGGGGQSGRYPPPNFFVAVPFFQKSPYSALFERTKNVHQN